MSTETTLFVDRTAVFHILSTEPPLFMDRSRILGQSVTKLPIFLACVRWWYKMPGQQATRLANMLASRSKQTARATPKGSLCLLCALRPASRPYLSLGLSIRATFFVDRNLKLTVVSTQTALFVDKTVQLTILSTRTALFMDSPRFRWREYGQQATRLANTPASRSKQTARATPKGSRSLLCAPSQISARYLVYLPPTNPSVATLILTSGGKTERRAVKQAIKVEPVVNTSSTMIRCLIPLRLS